MEFDDANVLPRALKWKFGEDKASTHHPFLFLFSFHLTHLYEVFKMSVYACNPKMFVLHLLGLDNSYYYLLSIAQLATECLFVKGEVKAGLLTLILKNIIIIMLPFFKTLKTREDL